MEEKSAKGRRLKKVVTEMQNEAPRVMPQDAANLLARAGEVESRVRALPGALSRFGNRIQLLLALLKDYYRGEYRRLPWRSVGMAVFAITYFLNPFDIVPDFVQPLIGYLDDATVAWAAFEALKRDVAEYCRFKGLDPDLY